MTDDNHVAIPRATTVTSRHTSVELRNPQLRKNPERANQPLMPLVGVRSFNLPDISAAGYIELVD